MNNKSLSSHKNLEPVNGTLYIVGTPIGNLKDLSSRAIDILKNVSFVACEDTRQTNKIMNKYEIKNNLISFNKLNSLKKIPKIINSLKLKKSVALVSDAGMPSICDPGEDLVKEAKLNGINIICIPGPCSYNYTCSKWIPFLKIYNEGFLLRRKLKEKNTLEIVITKNTILFESPIV